MQPNPLNEPLEKEYFHLQTLIEDFDKRAITIKAWSITFSFAGIGSAFAVDAPIVILVAGLSALTFWIIETLWKTFQNAHYRRVRQIEDYFKGRISKITPFQIGKTWSAEYREARLKTFVRAFFWPHVYLPHLVVVILSLLIYLLIELGYIGM